MNKTSTKKTPKPPGKAAPGPPLLIVLGASVYPSAPKLEKIRPQLQWSRDRIHDYFGSKGHVVRSKSDVLDLFNSPEDSGGQLLAIKQWLSDRLKVGSLRKGLIIYYIGHGHFDDDGRQYMLSISKTNESLEQDTSMRMKSLADVVKQAARSVPRYWIIDACFSGAALSDVQGQIKDGLDAVVAKINWTDQAIAPPSGSALLCSTSQEDYSFALDDEGTRFTTAFIVILTKNADKRKGRVISLSELCGKMCDIYASAYSPDSTHPEVYSLDQQSGDGAKVKLLPVLVDQENKPPIHRVPVDRRYGHAICSLMEIYSCYHGVPIETLCTYEAQILQAIVNTTACLYNMHTQFERVNANVMYPLNVRNKQLADFPGLHFHESHSGDLGDYYRCILELRAWAHAKHDAPSPFLLPVELYDVDLLFGAPSALGRGTPFWAHDTRRKRSVLEYTKSQRSRVAKEIAKYLSQRNSFSCFVSIPLIHEGSKTVGVLTVQSQRRELFLRDGLDRGAYLGYIAPHVKALAGVVCEIQSHNPGVFYSPESSSSTE